MIRGTTPTLDFQLETELDFNSITRLWLTITGGQHSKTWEMDQLVVDPDKKIISLTMSQLESLGFPEGIAEAQIRIKTGLDEDAPALATEIAQVDVRRILKGGVI